MNYILKLKRTYEERKKEKNINIKFNNRFIKYILLIE